jgi:hypothetical protein
VEKMKVFLLLAMLFTFGQSYAPNMIPSRRAFTKASIASVVAFSPKIAQSADSQKDQVSILNPFAQFAQ